MSKAVPQSPSLYTTTRANSELIGSHSNSLFSDWEVGDRYQLTKILGKGSYGKVAEATDRKYNKKVAIKQMKRIFDEPTDAKRAYREIHILRHLKHNNVIELIDVISTTIKEDFQLTSMIDSKANGNGNQRRRSGVRTNLGDLYLVFEYMDTDLANIFKSNQYMANEHIQFILYQILLGLKYIHSANVIHRDLKPANVLISCSDCTTKIADFGLSRVVDAALTHDGTSSKSDSSAQSTSLKRGLTEHVVTRWYRSPEVILSQSYSSKVDIWSVGCIFAELLNMLPDNVKDYKARRPIFPGDSCGVLSIDSTDESDQIGDESGQLMIIFKVMGTPTERDLTNIDPVTANQLRKLRFIPAKSLHSIYPASDNRAIDLLTKMLAFNPAERLSVDEAINHPYLASCRQIALERESNIPMSAAIENIGESANHLFENVAHEVLHYRQSDIAPHKSHK